jgi:hypothetical protein
MHYHQRSSTFSLIAMQTCQAICAKPYLEVLVIRIYDALDPLLARG